MKVMNGGNFEKLNPGLHQAVVCDVVDLGLQQENFKGVDKVMAKFAIAFETNKKMKEGDNAGKPFIMWREYTASLNDKSRFYLDMIALGKKFTAAELNPNTGGYDPEKLIGKNLMINIIAKTKQDGSTKSEIGSLAPLMEGSTKFKQTVDRGNYPKWIKEKLAKKIEQGQTHGEAMAADNPEDQFYKDTDFNPDPVQPGTQPDPEPDF